MTSRLSNLLRNEAAVRSAAPHIAGPDCLNISIEVFSEIFDRDAWTNDGLAQSWLAAMAAAQEARPEPRLLLPYRWTITADHLAEPGARPGTNDNAVGLSGPRRSDPALAEGGRAFRMYDDDGTLCYEGILYDPHGAASGFEPLDNFGEPNAGCTEIRYQGAAGQWVTL